MNTKDVLAIGTRHLQQLVGHDFDVLEISRPVSPDAAVNLAKIISKLSPLVGNLIEFNTCEYLNQQPEFDGLGEWVRQDPGFPDTIFSGSLIPTPGFEIKAWFPLATEITARFKDSQRHFADDQTHVAMLAWLPEHLIYGKPRIVDIVVVSGLSVAKARDDHYHNPPDYLVLEPEDTSARTTNLQQTNTNGYKFQGSAAEFLEAELMVREWGPDAMTYQPSDEYQRMMRKLISGYTYRLDTNFAKMDRIVHKDIELFKARVQNTTFCGMTIGEWNRLLSRGTDALIAQSLERCLGIREGDHPVVEDPSDDPAE